MPEIALLFPGQGSQSVGMVKGLISYPEAREVFRQAEEILGSGLWDLCLRGPETELSRDCYAQVAVHMTNCAYHAVLERMSLAPKMASGFSLGIFSALFAAGSLTFEQGLEGVRFAGEETQVLLTLDGRMLYYLPPDLKERLSPLFAYLEEPESAA